MAVYGGGLLPGGVGLLLRVGAAPRGVGLLPGVCSLGMREEGIRAWGVSAPERVSATGGGCLLWGWCLFLGNLLLGVSAPERCLLLGVSAREGVSATGGGCLL